MYMQWEYGCVTLNPKPILSSTVLETLILKSGLTVLGRPRDIVDVGRDVWFNNVDVSILRFECWLIDVRCP
jgi:hypothetical protein